jgi:hypothetical protein
MSERKPRSAAQVAAFEKAKAARESNMRKKFEAEQQEQQQQQQSVEPEVLDECPAEEAVTPPAQSPVQTAVVTTVVPSSIVDDDDTDYIELDTDALFNQLSQHKKEIAALRENVHSLKRGHEDMQTTWQQHDIGRRNDLSFV